MPKKTLNLRRQDSVWGTFELAMLMLATQEPTPTSPYCTFGMQKQTRVAQPEVTQRRRGRSLSQSRASRGILSSLSCLQQRDAWEKMKETRQGFGPTLFKVERRGSAAWRHGEMAQIPVEAIPLAVTPKRRDCKKFNLIDAYR